MGHIIAKDWNSYQYLVESIRKFPDQVTTMPEKVECSPLPSLLILFYTHKYAFQIVMCTTKSGDIFTCCKPRHCGALKHAESSLHYTAKSDLAWRPYLIMQRTTILRDSVLAQ